MRILVTGANGFIARNLCLRLRELGHNDIRGITRNTTYDEMRQMLSDADFVFHLAGVNRPKDDREYNEGNAGFTQTLCDELMKSGRRTPVVYASSIQAGLDNAYGQSKRAAEDALLRYGRDANAPVAICRLTNVFGKWARPHYNSVVATFCYQITRGLPVKINDPTARLRLLHIDDVVDTFVRLLATPEHPSGFFEAEPVYETTVGEVADLLEQFTGSRASLTIPRVGRGFVRVLYSTYVSYLPPESFSYTSPKYCDPRGEFVEMLKTPDCGQFSYFTAHPGVTRGEHYHHSKTEKFLVIRGAARFGFRSIDTGEVCELIVRGGEARIVETVPGWTHNITNVGEDELIVMLWANEIFDRSRPDTVSMKVAQ